ncbi:MAG: transcriptional repressor [Deltaproteobacteria bacterium]|nr:transcriptional repressor [Deltaproteobacteria bacterium]
MITHYQYRVKDAIQCEEQEFDFLQRNTKQREVIAACFSDEAGPLSVYQVHALAREQYPSLGIATVYRTVNALVEAGMLVPVVIGGTTRYGLAQKCHHPHFYCNKCDHAFCLESNPAVTTRLAPKGFVVSEYNLVVSGTCPSCTSENRRRH